MSFQYRFGPRVAPDGSAVAFKRSHAAPGGGKAAPDSQTLVLPIGRDGQPGRAWPLRIPEDRGVGDLEWSPDGAANERLFRLGVAVGDALCEGGAIDVLARYFEYWLMRLEGVYPALDVCPRCR